MESRGTEHEGYTFRLHLPRIPYHKLSPELKHYSSTAKKIKVQGSKGYNVGWLLILQQNSTSQNVTLRVAGTALELPYPDILKTNKKNLVSVWLFYGYA